MNLLARISSASLARMKPINLVQQPQFWLGHQWRILLLLLGSISTIIILHSFIFPSGGESETLGDTQAFGILSWLIVLIMFIGIGWIGFAASKVEIDEAIAVEIEKETNAEYQKLRAKQKEQIHLDDVRSLLPQNVSPLITMPRLAEHIIKNAEDRKFDSSMIMMQPFREEVLNDLFKINGLQKAALQLGIVGTFLGLIAAFIQMGGTSDISQAIPKIIAALKFSFSTSVAGLVTSLVISIGVILILKRQQESFYRKMETATDSLIRICRNARNKDVFLNSFDQIKETVDQVYTGVENQTEKIQYQTRTISDGIHKLTETKAEFAGFLKQISEVEGDFIGEMREIYDKLSPTATSAELKRSLNDAVSGIRDGLEESLENSLREYNLLNQNLAQMGKNMGDMEKRLSQQMIDFETYHKELKAIQMGMHEYVKQLTYQQGDFVEKVSGSHVSENLLSSVKKVGDQISQKQNEELDRVITNMNNLEAEISLYNKLVKNELEQQTPYSAIKTMVYAMITFVRASVVYVINLVKQLIK